MPSTRRATRAETPRPAGFTVEHGEEDASRYLVALQDVLDAARLRLRNAANDATGPAA